MKNITNSVNDSQENGPYSLGQNYYFWALKCFKVVLKIFYGSRFNFFDVMKNN